MIDESFVKKQIDTIKSGLENLVSAVGDGAKNAAGVTQDGAMQFAKYMKDMEVIEQVEKAKKVIDDLQKSYKI